MCVQLQEQLDTVDSILDLCTPQLKLRLQEVQQEVVERWEELRLHAEQREEELKVACQRYLFLNTVRTDGLGDPSKHFLYASRVFVGPPRCRTTSCGAAS